MVLEVVAPRCLSMGPNRATGKSLSKTYDLVCLPKLNDETPDMCFVGRHDMCLVERQDMCLVGRQDMRLVESQDKSHVESQDMSLVESQDMCLVESQDDNTCVYLLLDCCACCLP